MQITLEKGIVQLLFPFDTSVQAMAEDLTALLHKAASVSAVP